MASESRHVGEWIDRSAADVYAFVSNPLALPRWARGLGNAVENVDGSWFVRTAEGRVGIEFAPPNDFGVLDHRVTLPSGETVQVPMRVVPDGDGAEVVFTVRRLPDMTDEDLARDAGLVADDLATLKRLLEDGADRPQA